MAKPIRTTKPSKSCRDSVVSASRRDMRISTITIRHDPLGLNRRACRDRGRALAGKSTLNRISAGTCRPGHSRARADAMPVTERREPWSGSWRPSAGVLGRERGSWCARGQRVCPRTDHGLVRGAKEPVSPPGVGRAPRPQEELEDAFGELESEVDPGRLAAGSRTSPTALSRAGAGDAGWRTRPGPPLADATRASWLPTPKPGHSMHGDSTRISTARAGRWRTGSRADGWTSSRTARARASSMPTGPDFGSAPSPTCSLRCRAMRCRRRPRWPRPPSGGSGRASSNRRCG